MSRNDSLVKSARGAVAGSAVDLVRGLVFGLVFALAPVAGAQVLIASSTTSGGVSQIGELNPATGVFVPFMTVPVPAGFEVRYLAARPPCGLIGIVNRTDNANNRSRLLRIDPVTRTSQLLEFTAPLNSSYAEGTDWSPRHNAFMIGFAPLGNFGSTRLALFDENGVVSATSNALPVGDIDLVGSSATLDLLMDLNRTSGVRVYNVTTLFPNPAVTAYATPPVIPQAWDVAVHPTTGAVTLITGPGNQLSDLVGNTYVNGPAIQGGLNLRGLAWVRMAPVVAVQPGPSAACPSGAATFNVVGAFDQPATFRWQRESAPGVFVDLQDGSTASWDGNVPGFGATVSGAGTPSLTVAAGGGGVVLSPAHAVAYRCVIVNGCGSGTSAAAALVLCPADFNCDGFLDFFDYSDYVAAFEGGGGGLEADFNGDGFVDFFDYADFVTAFEIGC